MKRSKKRWQKILACLMSGVACFSVGCVVVPANSGSSSADSTYETSEEEEHYDETHLDYQLNDSGTAYTVVSRGICTESVINIPNKYNNLPVVKIERSAFMDDQTITELVVGNSVTVIDAHAFYGCINLQRVTMGAAVKKIEGYAFDACSALEHVTLNAELTNLSWSVFDDCMSLKSIVLGTKIKEMYSSTFYNCFNLEEIYYLGTPAEWEAMNKPSIYLTAATAYYYSETQPTGEGNYWHWVDGKASKWE